VVVDLVERTLLHMLGDNLVLKILVAVVVEHHLLMMVIALVMVVLVSFSSHTQPDKYLKT
jgi:hypothetical protein